MTRPIKSGDDKRVLIVRVRVTLTEKKRLEEIAASAGLTLSDWIRKNAIGSKPLFRKPNPDREVLLRLLSALNKIGSLTNQIARQLNRKQDSEDMVVPKEIIVHTMEGIRTLTNHLREKLTHGNNWKN